MPSTRWSHCGAEDLSVLQTIFWSAGASRNALYDTALAWKRGGEDHGAGSSDT